MSVNYTSASKDKIRVQLYMPLDLVKDIDEYAKNMGISRSNAIVFWCSQQIVANKMITGMDEVVETCKRIQPDNKQNPELVQKLSQLMGMSELYKDALSEGNNRPAEQVGSLS